MSVYNGICTISLGSGPGGWDREFSYDRYVIGKWKCYMKKYKESKKTYNDIWILDKEYLIFCYKNQYIKNTSVNRWVKEQIKSHISNELMKEEYEKTGGEELKSFIDTHVKYDGLSDVKGKFVVLYDDYFSDYVEEVKKEQVDWWRLEIGCHKKIKVPDWCKNYD